MYTVTDHRSPEAHPEWIAALYRPATVPQGRHHTPILRSGDRYHSGSRPAGNSGPTLLLRRVTEAGRSDPGSPQLMETGTFSAFMTTRSRPRDFAV